MDCPDGDARARRRLLLLLFVFFWSTHGGKIFGGDTLGSLQTAQALLFDGTLATEPGLHTEGAFGPDGRFYVWFGLVPMLLQLPAALLGALLPRALGGVDGGGPLLATRFLASLPFLVLALATCWIFEDTLRLLGVAGPRRRRATLYLALATPVWVYAGLDAPDLLLGGLLLASFRAGWSQAPARAGGWLGAAVCTKFYALAALPGLLLAATRGRAPGRRPARAFLVGLAPGLLAFLAYNHARYGHPLTTGYPAVFGEHLVPFPLGLFGVLLSPGKGLFVYAPVVLLAILGLGRMAGERPRAAASIGLVTAPLLLGISLAYDWVGDPGWGPRYAMAVVPLLMLGLPFLHPEALAGPLGRGLLVGAVAVGLGTNLLGAFQDTTWYSVALGRQLDSLELARRDGKGGPAVHLRAHYWIPDLSPLRAHARQAAAWAGGSRQLELPSGLIERKEGGPVYRLMDPPVMVLPEAPPDAWWLRFRPLAGSAHGVLLYALALLGWLGAALAWVAGSLSERPPAHARGQAEASSATSAVSVDRARVPPQP